MSQTIISSAPYTEVFVKKAPISTNDTISSDLDTASPQSSEGYCSDHSDCDSWGPNVFQESGGTEHFFQTLADSGITLREMPAGFDTTELMRELTRDSATEHATYIVNLTTVMGKLGEWRRNLPRVKPYYAIKCNNDVAICRLMAQSGCGFDCASKDEIKQCLAMGVEPQNLIYANPCKQANMLRFAREVEVRKMTADNIEELYKIRDIFPEARVVLRIAVDDSKSVCRFNSKFGAPPAEWDALLSTAKELDLNIAGFSFHVGSGCSEIKPFADAVASARDAFDLAASYGFNPTILDIGGGWPGTDDGNFTFLQVSTIVSESLDHHFPESMGVEIIGEPGRYMCCASHTYAVMVVAKRQLAQSQLTACAEIESFGARPTKDSEISADNFKKAEKSDNDPEVALYINDGVYGSFNCVVFDHAHVHPKVLNHRAGARTVPTKLFGPTCDSIDVVMPCTRLPEMKVGDWLIFHDMGAYTRCAASRFNGQGAHDVHHVWAGMP
jgi:ornithine decarboxylase